MSDSADSLSGRVDNVWPGRQCLTQHTAFLASQKHPAGRLSDPAHNLSDPANTRPVVRCLTMLTHARSYLNPWEKTLEKSTPRSESRGQRGCVPGQTNGRPGVCDRPERLCARPDIVCPARHCLPGQRGCLPGETMSPR